MRRLSYPAAIVFAACALTFAQSAPPVVSGTWQAEGLPWTIVLKAEGQTVTGTLGQNGAPANEIVEGKVTGNTVVFQVKAPSGSVMFTGKVNGDEIVFAREGVFTPNAQNVGLGLLGPAGPPEFKVSRVVEGTAWSGTIRNAPTARNATPAPNPRPVMLGTKKIATPHWRWRGGDKEVEVRTFTLPMGSFELSAYQLEADQLSYAFSRPGPGDEIKCNLTRQPDGKFSGRCASDSVQNFTVFIDLTPPAQPPVK